MFVVLRKADFSEMSSGGQADHSTAERPPGCRLASTPVAITVIMIAAMMDTKSMYPRIANSAKLGGRANRKRMIAEITAHTSAQRDVSSTILTKAIVPERVCEPTRSVK
jgi:hypothetical protein